jgi:hypothetical protein
MTAALRPKLPPSTDFGNIETSAQEENHPTGNVGAVGLEPASSRLSSSANMRALRSRRETICERRSLLNRMPIKKQHDRLPPENMTLLGAHYFDREARSAV